MFSAAQKPPRKTPQKPRNPPQTHHDFTTTKHPKIAKPPSKTAFSISKKIPKYNSCPHLFRHQSRLGKRGTPHAASEVVLPNPAPQT
jgi:hypothetical protein